MVVLVGLVVVLAAVLVVCLRGPGRGRSSAEAGKYDGLWLMPPVTGLLLCAPLLLWSGFALASYWFAGDEVERGVGLLIVVYVGGPSLVAAGLLATAVALFSRQPSVSRLLCSLVGLASAGLAIWVRDNGVASAAGLLLGGSLVACALLRTSAEHHDPSV